MKHDIAIKVEGVSKTFKLPHSKNDSIKSKLINLKDRKRGYEVQQALNNMSFEVKKGEFFGIVGRNGSGKSTLLKLISGIYTPDSGTVQVNGKLTPFIELGVGFNPDLSGRDNVFLNGALLGFSRKEMEAMYDEIVEFAELERFMDQKLKNYSSGMQVRLAFSIAIRANTDILVLDEVLAVGDEAFQRKCFQYFERLKKEKKTVILVTHSMDSVRKYCGRAMMIKGGSIIVAGSPEDVANEYSLMNLDSTHKGNTFSNKSRDVSDIKVTLLSKDIVSEKESIKVRIEYKLNRPINTKICIDFLDTKRNVPICASTLSVFKDDSLLVDETFLATLNEINDTDIQISVSIRDSRGDIIAFPSNKDLPSFLLRRSDHTTLKDKPTYAVLFSRGRWLGKKNKTPVAFQ